MSVRRAARTLRIAMIVGLALSVAPVAGRVNAAVIAGIAPTVFIDDAPFTRNQTLRLGIGPVVNDPGGAVVERRASNDPTTADGVLVNGVIVDEVSDWTLADGPDGPRTVYGQLKYASGAWSPVGSTDIEFHAAPATSLYFDVDPSVALHDFSTTVPEPDWQARSSTPDDRIYGYGYLAGPRVFSVSDPDWAFSYQDHDGTIVPGTYEVTREEPCTSTCASVAARGNVGCTGSGTVVIHEITFSAGGDLVSVAADFRLDCSVYGVMSGSLRYGSARPIDGLDQDPVGLDPGITTLGDQSDTTVTITNIGTVPTTLGEAGLRGDHPGDYAITDDGCGGVTLAVGTICTVDVRFEPGSFGYRFATLEIPDETARGSRRVFLAGMGQVATDVAIDVDPPAVGPGPAAVTITVVPASVDPSRVRLLRDGAQVPGGSRVVAVKSNPDRLEITQTVTLTPGAHDLTVTYDQHAWHLEAEPAVAHVVVPDSGLAWGWLSILEGDAASTRAIHLNAMLGVQDLLIDRMAISNDGLTWTEHNVYLLSSFEWLLTPGGGTKTVSVKWHEQQTDRWSPIVSDTIVLESEPPTATAPRRGFNTGATITDGAIPTRLPWSGSDIGGGVVRYELAQQMDGSAWTTVSTSLTSPSSTRALATEHTYRFRVRAVDKAGNVGAWAYGDTFRVSRFSEFNSRITYSGTWSTSTSRVFWGGAAKAANKAGARASITFTGRSVAWVSSMGPTRGKADVLVNGVKVATVDLYSATANHQRVVWAGSWTTAAARTITIRVQGTGGRPRVDVDAFVTAN